jgi:hypothetical protein
VPLDLENFGLGEMLRCSLEVRQAARDGATMEDSARRVCRYLYEALRTAGGQQACAMVRCYKTHPYGSLPDDLQRFAKRALRSNDPGLQVNASMRCLTLLATAGDQPEWNDRHLSVGHQAVPLPSPQIVQRAPMIAQLIQEFGLAINEIVQPTPDLVRNLQGKTYGVFHVEEAAGSPYIPAQSQFVERFGLRSVVGFGGSLSAGDLFAVILFTRVFIPQHSADRFRTIALDVKGCLLPFADGDVFDPEPLAEAH